MHEDSLLLFIKENLAAVRRICIMYTKYCRVLFVLDVEALVFNWGDEFVMMAFGSLN